MNKTVSLPWRSLQSHWKGRPAIRLHTGTGKLLMNYELGKALPRKQRFVVDGIHSNVVGFFFFLIHFIVDFFGEVKS